jgi:nicotinamidase-related amidase
VIRRRSFVSAALVCAVTAPAIASASTTALLVIDVQRALCSGEQEVFESRRVVDRINDVVRLARAAAAPVIFIQHEESQGAFLHGSQGWELDVELDARGSDLYLRKRTIDAFHNTQLQPMLRARGIRNLVVCGLQSEFCIDTTARRALALGYAVTLVADGHSTLDSGALKAAQITAHVNATLPKVDSFGPRARVLAASQVRMD